MALRFRLRSPVVQHSRALRPGTFLAQRREHRGGAKLYHLADEGCGFLVEIGITEVAERSVVLRSFRGAELR